MRRKEAGGSRAEGLRARSVFANDRGVRRAVRNKRTALLSANGENNLAVQGNLSKNADAFYKGLLYNKSITENGASQPHGNGRIFCDG